MKAFVNLSGHRFGKLLVVGSCPEPKSINGKRVWRCICDCGKTCIYAATDLIAGRRVSCGKHRFGPPGASGAHAIFVQYRFGARHRGIHFELTKEQFLAITSRNCTYCDAPPSSPSRCGGNSTSEGWANSLYLYNGIDRVDNSRGYYLDNCAPCCKQCNRAKTDMTVEGFLAWIDRVQSHMARTPQ